MDVFVNFRKEDISFSKKVSYVGENIKNKCKSRKRDKMRFQLISN